MKARSLLARPFAALARMIGGEPEKSVRRRGAFAGAQVSRLTLDWILTPLTSADAEQKAELRTLRARARELTRNTSVGVRYCLALEQNVVGDGFRLQAKNYTNEGTLFQRANAAIEREWEAWSEPGACTVDGKHSLCDVLNLLVRTRATDGEFLCEFVEGADNPWGFSLNILDADLLDDTLNRPATRELNEIRQGVEIDRLGRPVNYYLWDEHPADFTGTLQRRQRPVPAARIAHLFFSRRPRQTRGVPDFAPVMLDQRILAGYYEAELVAARIGAAKMGFISQKVEDGVGGDESTEPGVAGAIPMDADPGSFWRGEPGEELQMFDPTHPTTAFGDFAKAILHHLAAGLGISYGTLTGDLSQANYSSMRVGLLSERDFYKRHQKFVISHFLTRVYRLWIKNAILFRRLPELGDSASDRWYRVKFIPRGFPWISPKDELEAAGTELALGITTRTDLAAERGRDLEEVYEGLAEEEALAEEYDVHPQTPTLDKSAAAPAAPSDAGDTGNGDQGGNDAEDGTPNQGAKSARRQPLLLQRGAQ